MSLLKADLLALGNLPSTAVGRRIAFGMAVGLSLLALMSWLLTRSILGTPALRRVLTDGEADPLLGLIGHGLMTCPIVAIWLGLAAAQRQLFESPELMLWRQAPIPGFRGPLQVFLRAVFVSSLWSAALAAPFVVEVLRLRDAPAAAYAVVPVAIATCTAPLLASLMAVQIVLVRFLSGRWLRLLLAAIAALASVGFTVWLLLNLFADGNDRIAEIELAATEARTLPPAVRAAAELVAAVAEGASPLSPALAVLGWFASALAMFAVAAMLHPRAHERHLESDRPLWRRSGRRWPTSVAANVRKKEFAQVLQQPGALVGFLVFAVLVFALTREHVLVDGILRQVRLPRVLREVAAMLTWWFLAVLLVLYAHMGRLALWDGGQWSLYMASPTRPAAILRGKLLAVATFLLWPLLLVGASSAQQLRVGAAPLLWFVGFAAAGTLIALGVVAVIGTWPRLMRPDADGQIVQGSKSFLAAMVMITAFQLLMTPALVAWQWLVDTGRRGALTDDALAARAPLLLVGALGYGALVALLGAWLGGRNYRRLLAPR